MSSTTPPTTYLITGASRGLGLETATQLLAHSPSTFVIASTRDGASPALEQLKQKYEGRLETVVLDVTSTASIKAARALVDRIDAVAEFGLDVLIHNAGVVAGGHDTFDQAEHVDLVANISTNLYGPIQVTEAFLPLLRRGREKKIFTTSSIMGSLGGPMNDAPFGINYAISKAAVNMFMIKLARDLESDGFTVIPFHPGYVRTDINGDEASITKEESIAQVLKNVILAKGPKDTAKFFSYDGRELPW